ncbi:MAG TPA: phage portal protein [Terriglobia bacterium]|nr:phage portal protein [Terriglobia bacterium]
MKLALQIGKFNISLGQSSSRSVPEAKTLSPTGAQRLERSMRVTVGPGRHTRMYQAAQVSRLTSDWPITITSANAEILVSAIAMRSRLRQLERDDDYFRQMLWLLENNVIGEHGLMLRMKMKTAGGAYDVDANRKVRQAWHRFMKKENFTVTRSMTGVEAERLATRAMARDGAILFRKRRSFPNSFFYSLEPIEIDRLDHFWSRPAVRDGDNEIQFGIEYDQYRAPVAYWILTRHPGDVFAWRAGPKYRERVPADEIIALWTIERAGQLVGMPLWPSVASRLNHLHKYEESEAIASRVAAAKGGWFERSNENADYVGPTDAEGNKLVNTEPGQWEELPLGFKAVPNDPTHPTDAYPYFVKGQLRGAAAGANLPYNSVANDLEGVNFSSIRAGLLEARDGFRYLQRMIREKLVDEIFQDWLPYAMLSGQIDLPITRMKEILAGANWQGRRWPWVDPLKDVQADMLAIQGGLDSRRNVIAEGGRDIEDVFEEQEEDRKLAQSHGLNFDSAKSAAQPAPPDDDEGNGNGNGKAKTNGDRYHFVR